MDRNSESDSRPNGKEQRLKVVVVGGGIVVRVAGESGECSLCQREIEIFGEEALAARFLIVKLDEFAGMGGGKCLTCSRQVCIECAVKTAYGKGMRRLHCPNCGEFLAGWRYDPASNQNMGAFLLEPAEFHGRH